MIPPELVAQHRRAQQQLVGRSDRAVGRLLRLAPADAATATSLLIPAVTDVVTALGEVSATAAAEFYDQARTAARPPGRFAAVTSPAAPPAQVAAMVRWAVTPLWSDDPRLGAALSRLAGGTGRLITAAGHDTIATSSDADPQSTGWQRIARPGACNFCRMLADRGAVYSGDTVRFASHDNCHCSAVPSWDPDAEPASTVQYVASKRRITAADRTRVRAWMRENMGD